MPRGEVETLRVGEPIEVTLWDGRKLKGRYGELQWAKPEEYATRYDEVRRKLEPGTVLPELGAGARLVLDRGEVLPGDFRGVGPGFVWFREARAQTVSVIKLERVITVADRDGHSVGGARLDALVSERQLPSVSGLVLEQSGKSTVLDHGELARIHRFDGFDRPHAGRVTGVVIGLAVDVALVVAAASMRVRRWRAGPGDVPTHRPTARRGRAFRAAAPAGQPGPVTRGQRLLRARPFAVSRPGRQNAAEWRDG